MDGIIKLECALYHMLNIQPKVVNQQSFQAIHQLLQLFQFLRIHYIVWIAYDSLIIDIYIYYIFVTLFSNTDLYTFQYIMSLNPSLFAVIIFLWQTQICDVSNSINKKQYIQGFELAGKSQDDFKQSSCLSFKLLFVVCSI